MQYFRVAFLVSSVLLAACGKGTNDPRGSLDASVTVSTVPKAVINTNGAALPGFKPAACDVEVKRISYQTIGGANEATTASAMLAIPSGGTACDGDRPVLVYAHGTDDNKASDMAADLSDTETFSLLALFASQGYIVVAPNYTGYAGSDLKYHPYLVAEAQAADMVDAMRAAKQDIGKQSRVKWKDLYVAGYSQGGYVSMATHRALERDYRVEFPLAGTMHMSGPYDLPNFIKDTLREPLDPKKPHLAGLATLFTPMLVDAYQNSFKNIYTASTEIYNSAYAVSAVGALPGTLPSGSPAGSSVYALAIGSNKVPLALTGTNGLLSDAFVSDFTAGGATNKFLASLNSKGILYNFIPRAKTGLCYGKNDPVVSYKNTDDPATDHINFPNAAAYPNKPFGAVQYFKSISATTVTAFDLDGDTAFTTTNGDNRDNMRIGFKATSAAQATAKTADYHSALAPFCFGLAKLWFDEIRAKQ